MRSTRIVPLVGTLALSVVAGCFGTGGGGGARPCPSNGATARAAAVLVDTEGGSGNDSPETAQPVEFSRVITGTDGDPDWFTLTFTERVALTTDVDLAVQTEQDPATSVRLHSGTIPAVGLPDVLEAIPEGVSCRFVEAGTYFLRASDADLEEGDGYSVLLEWFAAP